MTGSGATLDATRRRYADQMTAGLSNPRLRDAFAAVKREAFLGKPPWTLLGSGLLATTTYEPAELYVDALVPLDAARGINNGSPALHAQMLNALNVRPGDRVAHIGAGTGYYSAILAELAGPRGHVLAVEYDADLAEAARANLAPWPQAQVAQGDGAGYPPGPAERIYVNFAVADLPDRWLDHLTEGGRLVLPLGAPDPRAQGEAARHSATGAVLIVTRTAHGFAARFDAGVAFIAAEGPAAGDPATRRALFEAFAAGGLHRVQSLRRGPSPSGAAWFNAPRWSLSADPPASE